jgi:pimeloyl-[acyl-carrier protein] synthase
MKHTADIADLDFDWTQPGAVGADYLRRLGRIRESTPILWSDHQQAWIVTRHKDIIAGLADRRLSNRRYHLGLERRAEMIGQPDGELLGTVRRWVFNTDGTDHTRIRNLLMRPFSRLQIERFRESVTKTLNDRLDLLEARESFDFIDEFALPFVAEALLDIIGMADVLTPEKVMEMAETIVIALVGQPDEAAFQAADKSIRDLTPIIVQEIDARRRSPRADLLTSFVEISENGDRLTQDDIISLFHVLILAAADTTAFTLTLMMPVLDHSKAHRDYIRSHPDRLSVIVEELQRFVGMQNLMHRIAAEDFEWLGQQIKAGDMVFFMLAAGNRDPAVYDNPDMVDFERQRKIPLMFAPGLHHCIGHFIAKMELEVALHELFRRYDRVRILEPELEYRINYMTRGFKRLNVRLEPL